jgi:hypothetical protein
MTIIEEVVVCPWDVDNKSVKEWIQHRHLISLLREI